MLEADGRVLAVTNHRKTSPLAFRKIVHSAARAAGREITQLKDLASPQVRLLEAHWAATVFRMNG